MSQPVGPAQLSHNAGSVEAISQTERALIRDLNELDLKLYEYVQSEFLNPKIEQLGSVLRRDIRAFDIANRVAAPLSGAFALRSALRRRVQRLKRPT